MAVNLEQKLLQAKRCIQELEADREARIDRWMEIVTALTDRTEELEEVIATFEKGRDRDAERVEELEEALARIVRVDPALGDGYSNALQMHRIALEAL